MQAVVLAGGRGTRLRDRVDGVPKPMAPVAGRPFLAHLLDALVGEGIERLVLSVGYLGEQIESYVGTSWEGVPVVYARETSPLGTGGAVRHALPALADQPFLVLNGDTLVRVDVAGLTAAAPASSGLVLTVCRVDDVGRFGAVTTAGPVVTGIAEKGRSGPGLINGGVYLLAGGFVEALRTAPEVFSFEADLMTPWIADHGAGYVETDGAFLDIGVPEDYDRADVVLASFTG